MSVGRAVSSSPSTFPNKGVGGGKPVTVFLPYFLWLLQLTEIVYQILEKIGCVELYGIKKTGKAGPFATRTTLEIGKILFLVDCFDDGTI